MTPHDDILLAVDFGTTHIKAGAFTAHGKLVALCQEATPMRPDNQGVACIDPDKAAAALMRALAEVAKALPPGGRAAGLGISTMAEAFVAMDGSYRPLRPIMPWLDLRQGREAAEWAERQGGWNIYRCGGLGWHPKFSLGKMVWIRENEPGVYAAVRHWLTMDAYVAHLLTGSHATEPTIAQRTACFDMHRNAWDAATLSALRLESAAFPELRRSGDCVGRLTQETAAQTGLPDGLPVYLGGHDHLCAAHGAGVNEPGEVFASMGTAEAAICLSRELVQDSRLYEAGLSVHPFVTGDCFCHMGSIQSSGGSFEWYARTFYGAGGKAAYDRARSMRTRKTPSGILYLPHLKGSVAPHRDKNARACFVGFDMDCGADDFLQAIYEGVSFEQRLILDLLEECLGMAIPGLTVSGGATLNSAWMRVKANAMNKTLRLTRNSQTALLGAAMRAGTGAGLYRDSAEAVRRAGSETTELRPEAGPAEAYTALFETKYRKLYQALANLSA